MGRVRYLILAALAALVITCCGCESDALAIDAVIESRHLPFGSIIDPMFPSPTSESITGCTRCGDSAL